MATSRIILGALLTAFTALMSANGGQVVWSSERMATNLTSTNSPLGDDFRFELGGFANGFVPTTANVASWRSNWITVGAADYNSQLGFFAASTSVDSAAAFDSAAYIWGFNRELSTAGAEWVLLTNPEWMLPSAGTTIAPPRQWSTGTATVAVLGNVNAQPGIHLQTAAVAGQAVGSASATAWLASYGLSEASDSQIWEADSDNDGVSNLLEYATGTHPLVASSFSRESVYIASYGDSQSITLTFDKNPDAMVHYQIELSSDLNQWTSGDDFVEVVSDAPDRMTVRDMLPLTANESRFFRLNVSLLP
ncbi:MAG: hypothetical protein R3F19_21045 [Verrucomicrobiales bacterium]